MSSELYAILAMAARYWFIALILLIALRAWRMTVKDSRRAKLLRDWSPETGCVGQFVVDPAVAKPRRAAHPQGRRSGFFPQGGRAAAGAGYQAVPLFLRGPARRAIGAAPSPGPGGAQQGVHRRQAVRPGRRHLDPGQSQALAGIVPGSAGGTALDEGAYLGTDPAQRPAQPQGEAAPVQESARRREKPERAHARSRRRKALMWERPGPGVRRPNRTSYKP